MTPPVHKPEPMQYGRCPKCKRNKIAVLLHPDGNKMATRRYYIRKHRCGTRLVPVAGSLQQVRKTPGLSASRWTGSK